MANTFTATQTTVLFTDLDGDGVVDPGETVTTSVTIANDSTNTNAANVSFNETLSGMTQTGGVTVTPIAFDDAYNAIGNVALTVGAGPGVLANDIDPNASTPLSNVGVTAITVDNTGTHGTAVLNTDGSFTFTPETGFTGTTTFKYTAHDAEGLNSNQQGTVTVTVGPAVWFIDNTAAAGGDGSQAHPFNSIAAFNTANDGAAGHPHDNDTIYLRHGTGAYSESDGINLRDGQTLVGQGQNLVITPTGGGSPITIETGNAGLTPTISVTGAGQHGIDLGHDNTISGLRVVTTDASEVGIDDGGHSVTTAGHTLTISGVSVSSVGEAVDIDQGGNLAVSLDSMSSTGSANQGIQLAGTASSGTGLLSGSFTANGGTISGSTGAAFMVGDGGPTANAGGTAAISYSGTITSRGTARTVDIEDRAASAGSITLSGTLSHDGGSATMIFLDQNVAGTITFSGANSVANSGTADAVHLTSNTGATINFTGGGLNIDTSSGTGFLATGGGTVSVTGLNNSVNATSGTALNISNTTIGANDVTFHDITSGTGAGSTANGIILDTTGSSGGLHVTGTGTTAGSGGTIQHKTGVDANFATQGTGIYLNSTSDVQLNNMQLNDFSNFGIRGNNVNGFTFDHSVLNGISGDNTGASDEAAIRFGGTIDTDPGTGLTGVASISNDSISGGYEYNIKILNNSGVLDRLTVDNTDIGANHDSAVGNGGDSFQIVTNNSATANVSFTNGSLTGAGADLFDAVAHEQSNMDVVFKNNNVSNNHANQSGAASNVLVFSTSTGNVTYDISDNTVTADTTSAIANTSNGIAVAKGIPDTGTGGTMSGIVNHNTIGLPGVVGSGSAFTGIFASALGTGTHTTAITNNTIYHYNEEGIFLKANDPLGGGTSVLNATVTGNATLNPDSQAFAGLWVLAGSGSGTENQVINAVIGDVSTAAVVGSPTGSLQNDFTAGDPANASDVEIQELGSNAAINLSKAGSSSGTVAAVIQDDNVGTPVVDSFGTVNLVTADTVRLIVSPISVYEDGATNITYTFLRYGDTASPLTVNFTVGGSAVFNTDYTESGAATFGAASGTVTFAAGTDLVKVTVDPTADAVVESNDTVTLTLAAGGGYTVASPSAATATILDDDTPLTAAAGGIPNTAPSNPTSPPNPTDPSAPPPSIAGTVENHLTQTQLDSVVAAATARWEATGLTAAQDAYLHNVTFTVADMSGLFLGSANPGHVAIDSDAAGYGWYVDANPGDDAEFAHALAAMRLQTDPSHLPAGHIDLLTTVEHELGHQLGLDDSYDPADRDSLMYGYLVTGERRLPGEHQADGATPGSVAHEEFLASPVQIGTLPFGKSVTITYQATIDSQTNQLVVNPQNHGTVSANAPFPASTSTNTVTTTLDTLILGGTIWNDNGAGGGTSANGIKDGTEPGVDGVLLSLFVDANNDDVPDTPGAPIATATTAGGGVYSFTGLAPGNYIVRVDQDNFDAGGNTSLFSQNLVISPVTAPEPPDPDNNIDNDDNGSRIIGQPAFSKAITLDYNTEPTPGVGNDTNTTLDFGFFADTPPVAAATSGSGAEDQPARIAITLSGNDVDAGDAVQSFSIQTLAANGSLFDVSSGGAALSAGAVIPATGAGPWTATVYFQPNADFNGATSFTYTSFDGDLNSSAATASITVSAEADIVNDTATTNEDTPVNVLVLANDTFEGTPAITGTTNGANGTVAVNNNGTPGNTADDFVVYTPNADFNGSDSFTYTVTSGGAQETATVNVTINAVADIVNDTATTNEDTAVNILVQANDTFENPAHAITGTTNGLHGTVTVNNNGTAGDTTDDFVAYTPAADYNGSDSFTYTVTSNGTTETATVNVTINAVADIVNDTATTNEDTPVNILVQANDTFEDPAHAITGTTNGANGTVTVNNNGTPGNFADDFVVYTPNADFNGADSFTYTVISGGVTETATVNVTINAVADIANDTATTNEDTPVNILVQGNDTFENANHAITGTTNGANGTVTVNNNGTPGDATDDFVVYTPTADFNGPDTFTYTVTSGGTTETANVNVTVTAVADIVDDNVTVAEDSGANNLNLLANDTFENPNRFINGAFGAGRGTVTVNNNGTPGDGTDDFVVYTPNADFNGSDSFMYSVSSGSGGTELANVHVTVNAVADIADDTASVNEDSPGNILVLANDTFEGTPAITGTTNGAHGTVAVNNNGTPGNTADDFIVYTQSVPDFNGSDSFTYTVTSGGVQETATVNVTINPVADIADDTASVNEDSPGNILVLANDTFEGTPAITGTTNGAHDTVAVNNNGTPGNTADDFIVYTQSVPDFNGSDSFTYTVTSGGVPETATVNVTINPVADIVADTLATNEDTPITANLITGTNGASADNFEDAGRTLTAVTQGANGAVTFLANGDVTYTPNADFNGADTFTYTVTAGGVTETATVSVGIAAVNDPPVLDLDANNSGGASGADYTAQYIPLGTPVPVTDSDDSVTDVDNATLAAATITITNHQANDLLSVNGALPGNIVASAYNAGTGVLTLTSAGATATLAQWQTALHQVAFSNASATPNITARDITVVVNDAAANSNTAHATITLDQPPVIVAGNTIGYTELQASPSAIDAGLMVTDVDSPNLAGATVRIASGFLAGDTLNFTNQNGITGSYNAATGVLMLLGSDTLAHYQTALESVTFSSTSHNPDNFGTDTSRTISWVANDGTLDSQLATTTINITAVNDAPHLTAPDSYTAASNTPLAVTGIAFTDADAGSGNELASFSALHGTLSAASGGGVTVAGSGSALLTLTGTLDNLNAFLASNQLTYTGTQSDTLGITIDDQGNSGPGGARTDSSNVAITVTGGGGGHHGFNTVTGWDPNWQPVAAGDFNHDGTTDLIWQNSLGTVGEWVMANGQIAGTIQLPDLPGWHAVASGDFNHDGTDDIMWQSAGGLIGEWLMGAGTLQATLEIQNMAGWHVAAAGDFNADGITDVIWDNGSGVLGGWMMGANGQIAGTLQLSFFPGWNAIATGDFNHDGTDDILWQSGDGLVGEWLMGAGTRQATLEIQNMSGWTPIANGDFNGDGTGDVMWRDASGTTAVWFMENGRIGQTTSYGSTAGQTEVAAGDFNHDGVTDVMWFNTATGDVATWLFDHNGLLI